MANLTESAENAEKHFFRGNEIQFDEATSQWHYLDGGLVESNWQSRPCGKCGLRFSSQGHDPCIANLIGVTNACCGHGIEDDAYVQLENGDLHTGAFAIETQKRLLERKGG